MSARNEPTPAHFAHRRNHARRGRAVETSKFSRRKRRERQLPRGSRYCERLWLSFAYYFISHPLAVRKAAGMKPALPQRRRRRRRTVFLLFDGAFSAVSILPLHATVVSETALHCGARARGIPSVECGFSNAKISRSLSLFLSF